MTWNELKEFCNSLNEEQLKENVIFWREHEAINDVCAEKLSEDHYIGDYDDDGCYPLSDAGLTIDDVDRLGLRKVYSVGDAVLYENI